MAFLFLHEFDPPKTLSLTVRCLQRLYTKYSFKEVVEASHCDLKPYGIDIVFVVAHMAKLPLDWKGKK